MSRHALSRKSREYWKRYFSKRSNQGVEEILYHTVLAMYAGAVVVPLIVSNALGFTQEQLTYLIAIDLLACGVATL